MQSAEPFFGLSPYHVVLTALGAGIILAYWIPRFLTGREPAASALLILAGVVAFAFVPGMPAAIDPRTAPRVWEYTSELAVIVALFGTGLRIDNLTSYRRWQPTIRLLIVAMPLTIVAVALLGYWLAGMTLAWPPRSVRRPMLCVPLENRELRLWVGSGHCAILPTDLSEHAVLIGPE